MAPFDCFKTYIGLKNHYCKDSYDYFKYCKKTKASLQSFYKRKDRFYFEKLSRQKSEKEIEDFFVANFVTCNDPETLWIGEIIKDGDERYKEWKKRIQSLSYMIKEQSEKLFEKHELKDVFDCSKGHPILLKKYLSNELSLETLVIYNQIFDYVKKFNNKLPDPVWETVSRRIVKYSPFLKVDLNSYKKILMDIILDKSAKV
jgi:hypothetical protein